MKNNDTSLIDLNQISLIHQFGLDSRGEMGNYEKYNLRSRAMLSLIDLRSNLIKGVNISNLLHVTTTKIENFLKLSHIRLVRPTSFPTSSSGN